VLVSNPTYSSDPADPRDVPAYDPSQGGTETGYTDTPAYTDNPAYTTGTPTDTEPAAGNPYTTTTGDPYATTTGDAYPSTGDQYAQGAADYSATGGQSTTGVAKDEAANLKDTAVDAGKEVAGTAKDEAVNVVSEAKYQAKSLLSTATSEVQNQASTQQGRLASTLRGYADELQGISQGNAPSGVMGDLVQQAASKGSQIAQWLEDREPADVLDELRRFARRRPVMFLALCGFAGVVAGRITRGAVAANTSVDSPSPARAANYDDYSTTAPTTGTLGYEQPAPTYGAYSDAPAGYAGEAGWTAETSVPAGYPDQGEPIR
jgi:hypothetical protein